MTEKQDASRSDDDKDMSLADSSERRRGGWFSLTRRISFQRMKCLSMGDI